MGTRSTSDRADQGHGFMATQGQAGGWVVCGGRSCGTWPSSISALTIKTLSDDGVIDGPVWKTFWEMDKCEQEGQAISTFQLLLPPPPHPLSAPCPKDLVCLEGMTNPPRMKMTSNQFLIWDPLLQVGRHHILTEGVALGDH